MARLDVPLRRMIRVTAIFSAAPVVAIAALAGFGLLGAGVAAIAVAAIVAATWIVLHRYLSDIYAIGRYVEDLAREGEASLPAFRNRGTLPELASAIGQLRHSWQRQSTELASLAGSTELILENLSQPLILVDRQRRIVRASVAARELLGGDLAGRDLALLMRNPQVLEAADRVLAGGDAEDVEFSVRFPVERAFRAWVTPLPAPAPDGTVAIIALYDLTAIKRSDQMRVDFIANASHELRTPLSVLLGCIKTLRGNAREDAEARDRFLAMMDAQADRMSRLVEDLLSLSRIELNEHTVPTGSVDLVKLIGQVADSLEFPATSSGMEVEVHAPSGPAPVNGNESELTQLFQNLIDNAIKYGRADTAVSVDIRPATGDVPAGMMDHDGVIAISVIDRGEGIPSEHLPRLTERFYRVDTSRSRDLGGTGLGLAIVKHIASRHRGTLRITSEVGEGSTFTVFLPTARAPDNAPDETAEPAGDQAADAAAGEQADDAPAGVES